MSKLLILVLGLFLAGCSEPRYETKRLYEFRQNCIDVMKALGTDAFKIDSVNPVYRPFTYICKGTRGERTYRIEESDMFGAIAMLKELERLDKIK